MTRFLCIALLCFLLVGCDQKVTEYYNTGHLFREYYLENGEIDGIATEYYKSGEVRQISNWEGGKLHGTVVTLEKSGDTIRLESYKGGFLDGASFFYKEGILAKKITYSEGKKNGAFAVFFKNGDIRIKGVYEGFQEYLILREYDKSGFCFRYAVMKQGKIFYNKEWSQEQTNFFNVFLPLKGELEGDSFKITLLHSHLDSKIDSVGSKLYIFDEEKPLKKIVAEYPSDSFSILVPLDEIDSIFGGFFCETLGSYGDEGCMEFIYFLRNDSIIPQSNLFPFSYLSMSFPDSLKVSEMSGEELFNVLN